MAHVRLIDRAVDAADVRVRVHDPVIARSARLKRSAVAVVKTAPLAARDHAARLRKHPAHGLRENVAVANAGDVVPTTTPSAGHGHRNRAKKPMRRRSKRSIRPANRPGNPFGNPFASRRGNPVANRRVSRAVTATKPPVPKVARATSTKIARPQTSNRANAGHDAIALRWRATRQAKAATAEPRRNRFLSQRRQPLPNPSRHSRHGRR